MALFKLYQSSIFTRYTFLALKWLKTKTAFVDLYKKICQRISWLSGHLLLRITPPKLKNDLGSNIQDIILLIPFVFFREIASKLPNRLSLNFNGLRCASKWLSRLRIHSIWRYVPRHLSFYIAPEALLTVWTCDIKKIFILFPLYTLSFTTRSG